MEQDFNSIMQKYKEELLRYDAMQRAAVGNTEPERQSGPPANRDTRMQADENLRESQNDANNLNSAKNSSTATCTEAQDDGCAKDERVDFSGVRNSNLQSIGMPEGINPSFISENTRAEMQNAGNLSENNTPADSDTAAAQDPSANTETGRLIVHVTALGQTTPIPGANVIISQKVPGGNNSLVWHGVTDLSGNTQVFLLPASPEANSEQPGVANPYVVYDVKVVSPGFYSLENLDAQVFSGQTSLLEADMVPLPGSDINGDRTITVVTPKNNL